MNEQISNLSDDAFRMMLCFFPSKGSTLSFGGDHAEMTITDRARSALNELLAAGAVEVSEPLDSWPNREYYKGGDTDLRAELINRPHLNPFKDKENFVSFTKKEKV